MKLVRDLIPAIIIESGGTCEWRYTDSKDEYTLLLNDKVQEEVQEYLESSSHEEALEEAGDVYEVVSALLSLKGISMKEAEEHARDKRGKRGGFKAGVVLKVSRHV
tara:strand:+ start:541 stop:858 length:318 start_codon:yes stop_codon:yes gene_type:complete